MAAKTVLDSRAHNLTGRVFGSLTVTRPTELRCGEFVVWECRCVCGTVLNVVSRNLLRGKDNCGCVKTARATKPGREYRIWTDLRNRCTNPNNRRFARYGARGISVCDRWRSFDAFLEDMGPCPAGMSIERKDNDGPYSPDNCRWATTKEQQRNFSRNRWLTLNGVTKCLEDWGLDTGLSADTIAARIDVLNWSVEDALTKPKHYRHQ